MMRVLKPLTLPLLPLSTAFPLMVSPPPNLVIRTFLSCNKFHRRCYDSSDGWNMKLYFMLDGRKAQVVGYVRGGDIMMAVAPM
jgi:hypothetical protein